MKIVDMHCDTISEIWKARKNGREVELRENAMHVDLVRMKKSGYLLQNFALFVDKGSCVDPWENVCALYQVYEEELEKNKDWIAPVREYKDIAANEAAGKMSALLTVEEGSVCKGEKEKLHRLYDMGVRMLTLTWNYPNELGYPNLDRDGSREVWKMCRELRERMQGRSAETADWKHMEPAAHKAKVQEAFDKFFYIPNVADGLTERGREFVMEMEQLGMIVDVSHLSDAAFYDVLECTKKPFVASHSNARSVCRNVRNLSDDMIRRLAERGGCMGLNFCADFLEEAAVENANPGNVASVVRHAWHIVKQGGVEVLGLGTDFDGIDTHKELPGAQNMELLWDALHKSGFTQGELDKIFYANVLRVYRDTLR